VRGDDRAGQRGDGRVKPTPATGSYTLYHVGATIATNSAGVPLTNVPGSVAFTYAKSLP
jgi:hypothetical protein